MQYRIVTNGKEFKIQRKGCGKVYRIKRSWRYNIGECEGYYEEYRNSSWEDVKKYELRERAIGKVRIPHDKDFEVAIFSSSYAGQVALKKLAEEDKYISNKDNWVEVPSYWTE